MPVKPFQYLSPTSVQEACSMLKEHGDDARILAGGQSLIPLLKLNLTEFAYLVDLKRVPGLNSIKVERGPSGDTELVIGALATHSEVARSESVRSSVPLLSETAAGIGHPLVRNRGTIGGSLSHCDPAADLCVTSLALDARMELAKYDGTRRVVHAQDFFKEAFTTALEKGEILQQVSFPVPPSGTGYCFVKLTLGHGDFPLIVVSVLLKMDRRKCVDVAIAMGGAADHAIRMADAEGLLRGKDIRLEDIDLAAKSASEASDPPGDLEVSAEYKKKIAGVLTRRCLTKALERSGAH